MKSSNALIQGLRIVLGLMALTPGVAVQGQNPVIISFSSNGQLTCSNLAAGSVATVEWASSLNGSWKTNWSGLEAVTADSNGVIEVSVPMFYRVRGVTPSTNPPAIETSVGLVNLTENGTGNFGVRLSSQPGANVTVNVASADTGSVSVSPSSLTFTPANYATYQTVTVGGVNDVDTINEFVTVTVSSTGLSSKTVNVVVTDDDVQVIQTSVSSLTIGEAGSGIIGVTLAFQPAANVTVSVSSSDPTAATASPTSLTFTPINYGTSQFITVSGVNDVDTLNESLNIALSSPGLTSRVISTTVNDDDL